MHDCNFLAGLDGLLAASLSGVIDGTYFGRRIIESGAPRSVTRYGRGYPVYRGASSAALALDAADGMSYLSATNGRQTVRAQYKGQKLLASPLGCFGCAGCLVAVQA